MSYATVTAVKPGSSEPGEDILEFRNGHGFGPCVWRVICRVYLGSDNWLSCNKTLWPLWRDERLPLHQRAVLGMTYDRVYIVKADYARAAADIRAYLNDFPVDEKLVNHWPDFAELLESDPDCEAIGIANSICENWWRRYDEDEEAVGADWDTAWSLYEYLEEES